MSKRILAHATTTFHTQVSTPVYSAPEVLGLDSNSETSEYTNSVDIWSLGCVIYELLVGTKLFISESQVSRYYFGKWPFPESTLKGLSSPTDDLGISLLKSMLIIQPGDRPTAVGALGHGWLTGLKSDKESSRDNEDETIQQNRDESSQSRKRKNRPAIYNRSKKRSRRNSLTQDSTSCMLPDVAFEASAGSQMGADPPPPENTLGAPVMTPSNAASTESAVVQMGPPTSESVPPNFRGTYSKSLMVPRKQIRNTPQTYHQGSISNTTLILLTNRVADNNWLLNPRQPSNNPNPYQRNSLQSTSRANGSTQHIQKKTHKPHISTLGRGIPRITH